MTEFIKKLDEDTSVPFKVMVPIITAIVMAALWINNTLGRIERGVEQSWTAQNMEHWTQELRDQNRTMEVPYPNDSIGMGQKRLGQVHRPR